MADGKSRMLKSRIIWLVSGGVAFFVGLVLAALPFYGVDGVHVGRMILFGGWIVGLILIFAGIVPVRKTRSKLLSIATLTLMLVGVDRWAVKNAHVHADGKNQGAPAQSNTVNGSGNTTGNINQNGSGNNAVIGNGNSVGNTTYNLGSPKTSGWLLPASDQVPKWPSCARELATFYPQGVLLIYGGSVAMTSSFPRDILVVKDVPRLVVDRDPKYGGIAVTVDIFGADGKIIAAIERNKFTVNPNNYFTMERPDRSTLRVVDQYKKQVLSVRYLNRHAIKFNALLYYPGLDYPIELKDDAISIGGYVTAENCSSNLGQGYPVMQIRSSKPNPLGALVY